MNQELTRGQKMAAAAVVNFIGKYLLALEAEGWDRRKIAAAVVDTLSEDLVNIPADITPEGAEILMAQAIKKAIQD